MADLSDPWEAIRALQAKVDRLEKSNPLESSSVTDGRVRFVGGTLRLDSGAVLDLEGLFKLLGQIVVQAGGSVTIQGEHPILLDQIDGAARITVGNARMVGNELGMAISTFAGNAALRVNDNEAALTQGARTLKVTPAGYSSTGVPSGAPATGDKLLAVSQSGAWKLVPIGSGGDGGPGTPVDPTDPTRTYRWPFARNPHGTYAGHSGIDWPRAAGTPIRAIGAGVVQTVYAFSGNTFPGNSSEPVWRGNCVVINHGTVGGVTVWSLYAHMLNAPALAVGASVTSGQVIGQVGDTGYSDGDHLHLEIIFNGSRLGQGQGGYERAISWLDANASGSWG